MNEFWFIELSYLLKAKLLNSVTVLGNCNLLRQQGGDLGNNFASSCRAMVMLSTHYRSMKVARGIAAIKEEGEQREILREEHKIPRINTNSLDAKLRGM